MRIYDLRQLPDHDLRRELEDSLKEFMNLRFRHATNQLNDSSQLGTARKNIARIKTVIRERQIQGVKV